MRSSSEKISRSELLEALNKKPVSARATELVVLESKDYEEMIHVFSKSFLEDPLMAWAAGLNDDSMDSTRKEELLLRFIAPMMGWANRPILVRKKGVVLGVRNSDGSLAGAMSLVPGSINHMGFVDILSNLINVGIPPLYSKEKIHYGPHGDKRVDAMSILEKKRKELMKNKKYIYIQTVGVLKENQGKGYGGKLLRSILGVADAMWVHLYLETESEENESLYKHFGFDTADTLLLKGKGAPTTCKMWMMIRNPSAPKLNY